MASVLSIVISMMSHYYFIQKFGTYGAALSMTVVYFIVLIITIVFVYQQVILFVKPQKINEYYDHYD